MAEGVIRIVVLVMLTGTREREREREVDAIKSNTNKKSWRIVEIGILSSPHKRIPYYNCVPLWNYSYNGQQYTPAGSSIGTVYTNSSEDGIEIENRMSRRKDNT